MAGGGADTITLRFGEWAGYEGSGGSIDNTVYGGGGGDTLILDGATITGNIRGSGAADTITLLSGNVGTSTYVTGGGGADTITLGFGEWAGYRSDGGSRRETVYGGGGTDTLILAGATINGNIIGDEAADTFMLLKSGSVGGSMDAGGGADTITFSGATVAWAICSMTADDIVTLTSGSLGELRGTDDADTLIIDGGATAEGGTLKIAAGFGLGFIDLRDGADSLTLSSSTWASYNGGAKTGSPAGRSIFGGAGVDTFILNGARINGNIIGDGDAETFMLLGGTVGGNVNGGLGADRITFNGDAAVSGYLQYAAADIVTLTSGSLGELRGTNDDDTIIIDGGANAADGTLKIAATGFGLGFIDLLGGADSLTLKTGTWASYDGRVKTGAPTGGAIYGGTGEDTFILATGRRSPAASSAMPMMIPSRSSAAMWARTPM